MSGIRDSIKNICPPWLQDGNAEKLMYACALPLDGYLENLNQGMRAKMPGQGTPTALPLSGADKLIDRGPNESDAAYALRLSGAHDTWRAAGNAIAVLRSVQAYFAPSPPMIRAIGNNSIWDAFDAAGNWTKYYAPNNWNWDGLAGLKAWWRGWVVIYPPSFAMRGTFDSVTQTYDQLEASGATLDTTATVADVAGIRALVRKWKGAHNEGVNDANEVITPMVIISTDPTLFSPTEPAGGGINPTGLFGSYYYSDAGTARPSRFLNCSYWEGE
jgi:hypothetical protein